MLAGYSVVVIVGAVDTYFCYCRRVLCLSVHLTAYSSVRLSVSPPVRLSVCHLFSFCLSILIFFTLFADISLCVYLLANVYSKP